MSDVETGETREMDYRFSLANERTFLAWIRTALALVAAFLLWYAWTMSKKGVLR